MCESTTQGATRATRSRSGYLFKTTGAQPSVEPGRTVAGWSFKNISKQLDSWDRINKSSYIIVHEKGKKILPTQSQTSESFLIQDVVELQQV
jgi:hypothetical protein